VEQVKHVRGKLLAGALIGAAALAFSISGERYTMVTGRDVLSIDLSALAPGTARKYGYADDVGRKLRFLLARGEDGQVRSVFDVCRECYSYHKGYAISGNELICRVCGNRYPIDRMTTGKASCVPVALAHREDRGIAKIRVADVLAGRSLF